jgi:hypothetical protein
MLAEEAMDGRAGDCDLMEPSEMVGDAAGAVSAWLLKRRTHL